MNIRFTAMAFAVAVQAAGAGTYDIGEEFGKDGFWNSDPVLFVGRQAENGFEFTSDQRESAASRRDGGVSCFGIPVYESRVEFGAAGGIERVELMLYARGGTEVMKEYAGADGRRFRRLERVDKTVSRDEFFAVLKKVRDRFASKGARQPKAVREQADGARQFSQTWPVPGSPARAVLTWNFRQNGKNVCLEAREFFGLVIRGERILHTAHQVVTGKKSFRRLERMFTDRRFPEIQKLVRYIRYTNGEEAIELENGGSIEFSARSRQRARGFAGISLVVYDEAQELTDDQVDAIMATLSASSTGTRQLSVSSTMANAAAISTMAVTLFCHNSNVNPENIAESENLPVISSKNAITHNSSYIWGYLTYYIID